MSYWKQIHLHSAGKRQDLINLGWIAIRWIEGSSQVVFENTNSEVPVLGRTYHYFRSALSWAVTKLLRASFPSFVKWR